MNGGLALALHELRRAPGVEPTQRLLSLLPAQQQLASRAALRPFATTHNGTTVMTLERT